MTSPRKLRTSEPQENPGRVVPRPSGQRPRRQRPRKMVILSKGLRLRDTEAAMFVEYAGRHWTTRLVMAAVGLAAVVGWVVGAHAW